MRPCLLLSQDRFFPKKHKNLNMKNSLKIMSTLFLLCALFFAACRDEVPTPTTGQGEVVYFNGNIYTVNADQPSASAMIVKDGIITFVGSTIDAQTQAGTLSEQIDLQGLFVMPGIHDVHLHPLEASSENFQFIIDIEETDPENYATDVEAALAANPGSDWLLGWGHSLETILDAERMPKEILDDIAPNRPVAIMEATSHSLWVNSAALEAAGYTDASENPTGGVLMREDNGELNGILIDNAGNLLLDIALASTTDRAEKDYQGLVEYGLPELAKNGITSVCDARTYWKRNHQDIWKRAVYQNTLTVRVNLGLWAYPTEEDASQIETIKSLYSNDPNSLLRINQIKLYSDGIIHNTTSAMHADFLVDYFGEPTNNGVNYFTEERIADYIAALEGTGFDFHIHAIGNRGIHESLNAIETSGTSAGRHRLTHVEFVDPADYPRFAALNVTADAQVAGDFTNPMHWHDNDYLVGPELSENIIPLRSLKENGARIALSSDWDVSSLSPFVGLQNAVTRTPQALSLEDAIIAYTLNAAYVMRQEDKVGSLEVGKEADFIVLDKKRKCHL